MINPMATGTVKRPSADLRRHRGRQALSPHPPAPFDDTPSGSLGQGAQNTSAPATLLLPEAADSRKTAAWVWNRAKTNRRHRAAATQPNLAPIDTFPDKYATADDLDVTAPHSRTIRGRLGRACARSRVHQTSVELPDALRAHKLHQPPTGRSHAAHHQGLLRNPRHRPTRKAPFTSRQLARAAQRHGAAPPLRIRLINAFRDTSPAPGQPMEKLTQPEPAPRLRAAKRGIVRAIPPQMFGRIIPPHLGDRYDPAAP